MSLMQSGKALLLSELVSGMYLTLKYFFKPKVTINYPHRIVDRSKHEGSVMRLTNPGNRSIRKQGCVMPSMSQMKQRSQRGRS